MTTGAPLDRNAALYGDLWRFCKLFSHEIWSAWPEIAPFTSGARMLEIGPGKFPHLPVGGTYFADLSMAALTALRAGGGIAVRATAPLPFSDGAFDVVAMFETLEHVEDDERILAEVARVLRPGGVFFMSCPMNPAYWTYYDGVIGHVRRYRGAELASKLDAQELTIERVAARDDRMDGWLGGMLGFGIRHVPSLTVPIVAHFVPRVAALVWEWRDDPSLEEAERRGGVVLRARRRRC